MNFESFKKKYQKTEVDHYHNQVIGFPKVSVLVQTFNHEFFIQECLESILMQETDFEFEILLGEDDSTDGTRKICIQYAEKYPEKIRLILHHPENKIKVLNTPTGNFNAFYNFFSAKGEFIGFCEGDDLWTDPLKLQKQVDLLRSKSALALTYHSYLEVNERGKPLPKDVMLEQPAQDINKEDLKRLTFHPLLSTVCFRNYFREQIPKDMPEVINVDSFLISLLGNHGSAGFIAHIDPSIYRRHKGGIWSKKIKLMQYRSKIMTFKKLKKYYIIKGETDIAEYFTRRIRNIQKMLIFNLFKSISNKSKIG